MDGLLIPEGFWDHQRRSIELSLAPGVKEFAYFHEQGTGKTATAITHMRNLFLRHKKALKTLILCPAVVVKNWKNEIAKFSQCEKYVELLTGSKVERIAQLQKSDKKIFVTNFEALDMDGLFWYTYGKIRKLHDHGFELLIGDESHRFKNPTAKRTKMAIRIADKIPYRLILTGTPILNGPEDIWAQFRILDGGQTFGESYHAFRNYYFIDVNAGMPREKYFPDYQFKKHLEEEVQQKIYKKAFRVLKKDCLDLPPQIFQVVECEMGKDQARCYNEMRDQFITSLRNKTCTATLAITQALRLQQIVSGHLVGENGDVITFKNIPRAHALRDLLEDDTKSNKVIIWAVFRHNYALIAKICEEMDLEFEYLTGEQNSKEKQVAIDRFTKGSARVLIANPGAGGTGVNLVEAATSIWFSRSWKLEDRLQALARNHRGGSNIHASITVRDLCTPGTIDELVLQALSSKENFAERLLSLADVL